MTHGPTLIGFPFQVMVHSDLAFAIGVALFGWSGGHIGALCMMFGPKLLTEPEQQSIAANVMVSFIVLGLAVGAAFSSLCIMLL
jgi:equilibrative nucleoside transporter 1/2/3